MSEEYSIDPVLWFTKRELNYAPLHFTMARSPISIESKKWIISNLRGRFCIIESNPEVMFETVPSFEDPQEAVMYELMWSS